VIDIVRLSESVVSTDFHVGLNRLREDDRANDEAIPRQHVHKGKQCGLKKWQDRYGKKQVEM
jgi:hypothetical protein